jgi:hypothetical protein
MVDKPPSPDQEKLLEEPPPDEHSRYNPTGGRFHKVPLDCPDCGNTLTIETSPKGITMRALFCEKCKWMPTIPKPPKPEPAK